MTRGYICNNPMNLMDYPSITWHGQIRPTRDPEGRLCTFDTIVDGIRAGAKNLLSYYDHDGCETVDAIINRFAPNNVSAPADKNPTESYINFVCKQLNVVPMEVINLRDDQTLNNLCAAIVWFEQGFCIVNDDDMKQAIQEALAS